MFDRQQDTSTPDDTRVLVIRVGGHEERVTFHRCPMCAALVHPDDAPNHTNWHTVITGFIAAATDAARVALHRQETP